MAKSTATASSFEEVATYEHGGIAFSREGPRQKRQSGRLADIIQTLYSEHKYIESLLDTLEAEAEKLRPGKIPDYHLLLDIVDYLTRYPDQYHHPREDMLFSGILDRDPSFKQKLDRLLREHETLRGYNDQLFTQLSEIADGAAVNQAELRESIRRYVAGYQKHMAYEAKEIFPQARGTLSAADLRKLSRKTRYLDDPLFGNKVLEQYRRLERRVRSQFGIAADELVTREMSAIESAIASIAGTIEKINGLRENLPAVQCPRSRGVHRGRNSKGPSWQAQVMNACTRVIMKPMMMLGSIESMRGMTTRFDAQQERLLPKDVQAKTVNTDDFDGEWVRIARKRPNRTLLYFPGGGFVMRTAAGHRGLVARICRTARCKGLVVHYRLAPETPFPGGLEDCLAAYHHLLEQGFDPGYITIAGDSAGGGLVLSTLLALRDEGSPMPASAIVLSPLGDLTYSGESRRFNKRRDPMLPTHRASQMHDLYMGDALPEDRYVSPVLADFEGLPPILGQVGSTEILLDDTVRAAIQADKAGVPFYLEIWRELPHVFPMFGMLPESQIAIDRMSEFINTGMLDELPTKYGSSDPYAGRPRESS